MSNLAVSKEGKAVLADAYSEEQWALLKADYTVGQFLMPCCGNSAILKTSPNFLQFFAHYSDECETSPESIWHLRAKEDICSILKSKNIAVELERSGNSLSGNWKADVYFEYNDRRIAIEVQKSYQQLDKYLNRQEKYKDGGVESYWLLYKPRYFTLVKSLAKYRIKTEFNGKFPPEGYISPCLPTLPIAFYETDDSNCLVRGTLLACTLEEWINSLISLRFLCVGNVWKVL
ncbi:MAG: competence protein CoiA family protein [Nitrospirales bacterium]